MLHAPKQQCLCYMLNVYVKFMSNVHMLHVCLILIPTKNSYLFEEVVFPNMDPIMEHFIEQSLSLSLVVKW